MGVSGKRLTCRGWDAVSMWSCRLGMAETGLCILCPQGGSLAAVIRSPTPLDPSPRSQYFSTAGSFNGEGGDRAPRTVPQPQRLCYFWTGDMSEL